ncbi:hypothetical protein pEaSNUABM5_00181 [Erwinia phage pEa_SNUABM_5]|uniref:Uncharacterized protein n=1 Tax=Erwinia phage pEa_SNUABM_5 TaxID=2797313 RepID=A0A7T8EPK0_9CAUD|nr:hypothetical protein MPK73_gp181 [Erwinia phage pEa_SNUABM_5]QQO90323.1 hypothetical protein pEaSNUABM5_00181 [Erwinia phage pEa_SNUABM_5]
MLNRFYQKQQLIMTMLGYYDGVCDGIWGPKCIAAKAKWETEDDFEPAVPSNGLPFVGRGKLPKGMNYTHKGLDILWDKWDQARADEILNSEMGEMLTAQHVHDHVMQAQDKQQDVTPEPEYKAQGPSAEPEPQVTTLKPFEQPEPDSEQEQDDEIVEENIDPQPELNQQQATSDQAEKRGGDWLNNKRRKQ